MMRDRERDAFLERQGYRIVRIAVFEVLRSGDLVIRMIREQVSQRMQELGMHE